MNSRAMLLGPLVALLIAVPAAAAGKRDDLLKAMDACTVIADNAARLACYDALKPQVQAALSQTPEQVATDEGSSWFGLDHVFSGRPAPQTEAKAFGSDKLPQEEKAKVLPPPIAAAQDLDSITAKLTDYSFTLTGRFVIFLDNGQIWRQVDGDTGKARFKKVPADNTVVISRGLMSSYQLNANDSNTTFIVKRMK